MKTHTSKLYYKKFTHKVAIRTKFDAVNAYYAYQSEEDKKESMKKHPRTDKEKILKTVREYFSDKSEYKTVFQDSYFFEPTAMIYFSDPKFLEVLENKFSKYIKIIHAPVSDSHVEAMQRSERNVVRDSLYYGKYRYKFKLNSGYSFSYGTRVSNEGYSKIKKWLVDSKMKAKTDFLLNASYYESHLYIKEKNQAFKFKLAMSNFILDSEIVILTSELE